MQVVSALVGGFKESTIKVTLSTALTKGLILRPAQGTFTANPDRK